LLQTQKRGTGPDLQCGKGIKTHQNRFARFVKSRQKRLIELAEERTVDEDMQEKIDKALLLMVES